MHSRAAECPKCAGAMEPGFLRERHFVMTYRCERCGFLESYASSP